MFYVIYFAVIALALYLIFHDRFGEEGHRKNMSSGPSENVYHPENQNQVPQVPQTPQSPAPKPLEPAPRIVKPVPARPAAPTPAPAPAPARREPAERELSWSYLYKLEYDESLVGDVMETEVTGMRHYCSLADLGPVNGIIQPEPENPHDPSAQVVIRADGKKLGYIARNTLPEYQNFNPTNAVCPFAGHVKVTRQGYIWADILVAIPMDRDYVKEELTAYMDSEPGDA